MIKAKLITGGNRLKRADFANRIIKDKLGSNLHPDLMVVQNCSSVTINQVREIKKRLSLKPYRGSLKIVLIAEAEKITLPAQNALLKTLEEPPGEALIILLAPRKEFLIPTIISRCQIINLPQGVTIKLDRETTNNQQSTINQILSRGVGERLLMAEEYSAHRDEAIDFCQKQLATWRSFLKPKSPIDLGRPKRLADQTSSFSLRLSPYQITRVLRHLHQALIYLKANVNPRLVIENLFLSYPWPMEKR